jgi:hypothetical protein
VPRKALTAGEAPVEGVCAILAVGKERLRMFSSLTRISQIEVCNRTSAFRVAFKPTDGGPPVPMFAPA